MLTAKLHQLVTSTLNTKYIKSIAPVSQKRLPPTQPNYALTFLLLVYNHMRFTDMSLLHPTPSIYNPHHNSLSVSPPPNFLSQPPNTQLPFPSYLLHLSLSLSLFLKLFTILIFFIMTSSSTNHLHGRLKVAVITVVLISFLSSHHPSKSGITKTNQSLSLLFFWVFF